MRHSILFTSLTLSAAVLANPMGPPPVTQGPAEYPGAVRGAGTVAGPGVNQQLSVSSSAQNYANKNNDQEKLDQGKQVMQQTGMENPNVPNMALRAGPHDGGSQGPGMTTIQMPAQHGGYNPPQKGQPPGTMAAHIPSTVDSQGNAQRDPTRPVIPQPEADQGNPANSNKGKTSDYNPNNPVNNWGRKKKRSLTRRAVDVDLASELMLRRQILARELMDSLELDVWLY